MSQLKLEQRQPPVYIVLDCAKRVTMHKERGAFIVMAATVSVNSRFKYEGTLPRLRCSYRKRVTSVATVAIKMQFHTCFYRPVTALPRRSLKGKRPTTALMVELAVKGPYRLLHFMQRAASKKEVATCVQRYAERETARS